MWNPVYMKLKNFISHKNTEYHFVKNRNVMIYGKLIDEEDADSNGAGKSAFVKAITICLVDLPNRDLNKEDYIMDGEKNSELEMLLENPVNGATLVIIRNFYRNKSSEIKIYENEEFNKQITSVNEGNERILELLDIGKEDLLNYFIINQDNSHSFFDSTDNAQKKIISRFTNSELVDRALDAVDVDLKEKNEEIDDQETKIEEANTKIETYNEQIEYEEKEKEEELEEKIEELDEGMQETNRELNKIKERQKSKQLKFFQWSEEIEELKNEISSVTKIEDDIQKKKDVLEKKSEELTGTKKLKGALETSLAGEIECPKCNYKWTTLDPEANLGELREAYEQCGKLMTSLEKKIEVFELSIENLKSKVSNQKAISEKLERLQSNVEEAREDLKGYKESLNKKETQLEQIKTKIEDLKDFEKDTKRIKDLKVKIKDRGDVIAACIKSQESLELEKDKIDFWRINFGLSGFKTFLVNKVLLSLEGYINYNLSKFYTNLRVKINGYRILKTGEVRENIEVLISKNNETWGKYKKFSGGQKGRINVCGILTFQNLINKSSKSGGLNLLILDEFFEGLDTKGQKMVLPLLERSGVTNLVISHNNSDIGAENEIWMKYEKEISTLLTDRNEIKKLITL